MSDIAIWPMGIFIDGSFGCIRAIYLILSTNFLISSSESESTIPNLGDGIFPAGPKTLPNEVATAGIFCADEIKKSYFFISGFICFLSLYLEKEIFGIVSIMELFDSMKPHTFLSFTLFGRVMIKLSGVFLTSNFLRFTIKSIVWLNFLSSDFFSSLTAFSTGNCSILSPSGKLSPDLSAVFYLCACAQNMHFKRCSTILLCMKWGF